MKITKLLFASALLALSTSSFADVAYSAEDVNIEAGGKATLTINLDGAEAYTSATIDLVLPAGISIGKVMNEDDEEVFDVKSERTKSKHSLEVSLIDADANTYRIMTYSSNNGLFKDAGALFIVGLVASADIKGGEHAAKIIADGEKAGDKTQVLVTPEGDQFFAADVEFKIIVPGGEEPEPEPEPYVEPEGTHQLEGNGLGNLVAGEYTNIGAWAGTWSGNSLDLERDWSKFDYLWIKYKDFSGAINFGIMYSEWIATQSWGEQFKDENVAIKDPSGVIGVKINHTDKYVNGNKPVDAEGNPTGDYIGDIFSQHIREIFIQATAGGSNITIEEMWLGSEADYLKAVEDNKYVDPTVYAAITDDKCFFSKEYPSVDIVASTVEDGVIVVNSPAKVSQDWDSQFWIWTTQKLPAGTTFKIAFDYKASEASEVGTQCHNNPGDYVHWSCIGNVKFGTDWATFEDTFTVPNECDGQEHMNGNEPAGYLNEFHSIAFNLTKATDIIYYFKNIKIEIDEKDVAATPEYFEPAPPTGIKSLDSATKSDGLYNLAGQKVDKNYKGIVIQNGKKRMNK